MKFLIFNILVFFALGYLLTSNSNQNFKSWFTDKKDQITNLSKKDYVDKLKTAVSSNSENSSKRNLSENKVNNEEAKLINILENNDTTNEKKNYSKMKVDDLRSLVVTKNLTDNENALKLKKSDLIDMLKK